MATDHTHGSLEPTDDTIDTTGRALRPRLTEAGVTLFDALATKTGIRPSPAFKPDGDWVCDDDVPLRKTWTRKKHGLKERVQLVSSGLSGTWQLVYQGPDGTSETVETDLEREAAYREAERFMADVAGVRPGNRTGRAAE